jgi:NADH dehydrogenase
VIRWYHLRQVPLMSRRLRILADGTISALFRRDIAELGTIEPRRADA